MSASLKCDCTSANSSRLLVFYETSTTGIFDGETSLSTSNQTISSSGSSIRAVAVPISSTYRRVEWTTLRSTTENTDYGMIRSTTTSVSGDANRAAAATGVNNVSVSVIDPHGTHSGTDSQYVYKSQFFGSRHKTTASGYTYAGAKVTLSSSSSGEIISSGGTTSGLVTTFPASYNGAIIVQAGSSGSVTIEFLYSEPKPRVTLTYNANGGSPTPSDVTVDQGTRITLANAPTRNGYNFAGWLISGTKYAAGDGYTVNSNVTATAQWTQEVVYTVSFDKNSSDVTGDSIPSFTVTQGSACILPGAVLWAREGWIFIGWSTRPDGSVEKQEGDPFTPTANTIFYAVWTKTAGDGAQYDYYKYQTTLRSVDDHDRYVFLISSNVPTEDITLKYQSRIQGARVENHYSYNPTYNPNPKVTEKSRTSNGPVSDWYTTLFASSGSDAEAPNSSQVSLPGDHIRYYEYTRENNASPYYTANDISINTSTSASWEITAPELENYDFVGWFTLNQSYPQDFPITNSLFVIKISEERTITYNEACQKANYVRWFNQEINQSNLTSVNRKYHNYLQARYVGKLVTVLFDATGGILDDFYRDVRFGSPYGSLPTPIRKGYTFDGWYTQETGGTKVSPTTTVTRADDHLLFAHWTKNTTALYAIFKTIGTVSPASKAVTKGSAYGTLPTPTRAGFTFDGWYTKATGGTLVDAATVFNEDEDIILYARWTVIACTVTFDANGGTCDSSTKTVSVGVAIGRLPTAKFSGKNFDGWYTAREGGMKVTSSTIVNTSMTLYAHFNTVAPTPWVTIKISD